MRHTTVFFLLVACCLLLLQGSRADHMINETARINMASLTPYSSPSKPGLAKLRHGFRTSPDLDARTVDRFRQAYRTRMDPLEQDRATLDGYSHTRKDSLMSVETVRNERKAEGHIRTSEESSSRQRSLWTIDETCGADVPSHAGVSPKRSSRSDFQKNDIKRLRRRTSGLNEVRKKRESESETRCYDGSTYFRQVAAVPEGGRNVAGFQRSSSLPDSNQRRVENELRRRNVETKPHQPNLQTTFRRNSFKDDSMVSSAISDFLRPGVKTETHRHSAEGDFRPGSIQAGSRGNSLEAKSRRRTVEAASRPVNAEADSRRRTAEAEPRRRRLEANFRPCSRRQILEAESRRLSVERSIRRFSDETDSYRRSVDVDSHRQNVEADAQRRGTEAGSHRRRDGNSRRLNDKTDFFRDGLDFYQEHVETVSQHHSAESESRRRVDSHRRNVESDFRASSIESRRRTVEAESRQRSIEADIQRRRGETELHRDSDSRLGGSNEAESRRCSACGESRARSIDVDFRRLSGENDSYRRVSDVHRQNAAADFGRRSFDSESRRRRVEDDSQAVSNEANSRRSAALDESRRRSAKADTLRPASETESLRRSVEADTPRPVSEAESRRRSVEAESRRRSVEAESRRRSVEADTPRPVSEAESRRRSVEVESRRRSVEADTPRPVSEAESRRRSVEAESRRRSVEADTPRPVSEAESRRRIVEAESRRRSVEAESRRRSVEAESHRRSIQADTVRLPSEAESRRYSYEGNSRLLSDKSKAYRQIVDVVPNRQTADVGSHRKKVQEDSRRRNGGTYSHRHNAETEFQPQSSDANTRRSSLYSGSRFNAVDFQRQNVEADSKRRRINNESVRDVVFTSRLDSSSHGGGKINSLQNGANSDVIMSDPVPETSSSVADSNQYRAENINGERRENRHSLPLSSEFRAARGIPDILLDEDGGETVLCSGDISSPQLCQRRMETCCDSVERGSSSNSSIGASGAINTDIKICQGSLDDGFQRYVGSLHSQRNNTEASRLSWYQELHRNEPNAQFTLHDSETDEALLGCAGSGAGHETEKGHVRHGHPTADVRHGHCHAGNCPDEHIVKTDYRRHTVGPSGFRADFHRHDVETDSLRHTSQDKHRRSQGDVDSPLDHIHTAPPRREVQSSPHARNAETAWQRGRTGTGHHAEAGSRRHQRDTPRRHVETDSRRRDTENDFRRRHVENQFVRLGRGSQGGRYDLRKRQVEIDSILPSTTIDSDRGNLQYGARTLTVAHSNRRDTSSRRRSKKLDSLQHSKDNAQRRDFQSYRYNGEPHTSSPSPGRPASRQRKIEGETYGRSLEKDPQQCSADCGALSRENEMYSRRQRVANDYGVQFTSAANFHRGQYDSARRPCSLDNGPRYRDLRRRSLDTDSRQRNLSVRIQNVEAHVVRHNGKGKSQRRRVESGAHRCSTESNIFRIVKTDSLRAAESRRTETDSRRTETDSRRTETDKRRTETDSRRTETDSRRTETDRRRTETDSRCTETDSRRSEIDSRRAETDSRRTETDRRRSEINRRHIETGSHLSSQSGDRGRNENQREVNTVVSSLNDSVAELADPHAEDEKVRLGAEISSSNTNDTTNNGSYFRLLCKRGIPENTILFGMEVGAVETCRLGIKTNWTGFSTSTICAAMAGAITLAGSRSFKVG